MLRRLVMVWGAAGLALMPCLTAQAVYINLVTVGNPGNPPNLRHGGTGPGAVSYTYAIGKYDVTASQYCAFLNAVAATDTYGLYNPDMVNDAYGCEIQRAGSPGSYTYTIASAWANRPVNYVSWGDAARFVNWLQNGQPTGSQDLSTTEDGAYYLNGEMSDAGLLAITRKPGATWWIPSDNEWCKAAYYDPNKPGGAGYWDYPTRSDTVPSNVFSTTGTNNANYNAGSYISGNYTIGSPYWRTEVGAFAGSPGPYGTFDQGGNVFQWDDCNWTGYRGIHGGSFGQESAYMFATGVACCFATNENGYIGFRVASIPRAPLLGDANSDGSVSLVDLSAVLTNYNKTGMAWSQGDFTGDGAVDMNDLSRLLPNYNKSAGASAGAQAVPEPCTVAILFAVAVGLLARAWRRQ